MNIGKLDRRITLERLEQSVDTSTGEPVESWVPFATVWAAYMPVSGNEPFTASQRYAEVTTRFRIRYHPQFTPLDRIAFEGKHYDVVEVLELGRKAGQEIRAVARAEPVTP